MTPSLTFALPRFTAALVAAAAVTALPSAPRAQEPAPAYAVAPPAASGPAKLLEMTLGFVHFDYEERKDGIFLDGEKGFVPGVGIALQLDGEKYFGRFTGRLASGQVDYDGHVQSSDPVFDGLDLRGTTDTRFVQGEVLFGAFLDDGHRVAVLGGVGKRQWRRSIQSNTVTAPSGATAEIAGLDETYDWFELQAGLRAAVVQTEAVEALLEARVVRTAAPTMKLDLSSLGGSGSWSFDLGARTGFRVAGSGRLALSPTLLLFAGAYLERYAFGESPVNAYGFLEPSSTTMNVGADVGLAFRL